MSGKQNYIVFSDANIFILQISLNFALTIFQKFVLVCYDILSQY